ncbi:MAG: hypothetical protein WBX01_05570 [Nitrososphaeraceae archaeon]
MGRISISTLEELLINSSCDDYSVTMNGKKEKVAREKPWFSLEPS